MTSSPKALQEGPMVLPALALDIRTVRPAAVGSFVPSQAEPAQVFDDRLPELGLAAVAIKVFHPQQQPAAGIPGALPRQPKRAGVPQMKKTGGRRRDSTAIHSPRSLQRLMPKTSSRFTPHFCDYWRCFAPVPH